MSSVLLLVASIFSSAPSLPPEFATLQERVDAFLSSVSEGAELTTQTGQKWLIDAEIGALANLKGCSPKIGENSRFRFINIVWHCDGNPVAERVTSLKHESPDTFSVWINPREDRFAPTESALATSDLPSREEIALSFVREIRRNGDPTLDGLIPITPEHLAKIAALRELRSLRLKQDTDSEETVLWPLGETLTEHLATRITFDDDGRPIGLTIWGDLLKENNGDG